MIFAKRSAVAIGTLQRDVIMTTVVCAVATVPPIASLCEVKLKQETTEGTHAY